ncbi:MULTISPECIES: DUF397 domain-containing protein [Streptomyces]|uniref:DUF397 domain-containing protein n=1 Tax=Streptomyces dengpaensis TaxID=2049881 RepID=A0ABM6T2W2_9ACTN|nr:MULTISPECIES: DUF397 domain-containing protein [Streptomyces]AVH61379.1 DUF397 domain-containing protein [Streptomyces dengpaensis]PIB08084.1 hypothetical protein B1C81_16890 [Streptomyces sp. HG99]
MTTPGNWQKSSFSGGADGNNCLELAATPAHWQKSSFSEGGEGNTCVELTATPTALHLRESDDPAAILTTTPPPLAHLLHHIKTGGPRTPSA